MLDDEETCCNAIDDQTIYTLFPASFNYMRDSSRYYFETLSS